MYVYRLDPPITVPLTLVFRDEIPEMIGTIEPLAACFALVDLNDSRYQYIISLRQRFGTFLQKASVSLRAQGDENTIDAVQMLVSYCAFAIDSLV